MMWLFVTCENANLTAVKWAHAVNSQAKLDAALASNVNAIEADVLMGYYDDSAIRVDTKAADIPEADVLKKKDDRFPIMSHTDEESDLTLELFLAQVKKYNTDHNATAGSANATKLDFKSTAALTNSVKILKKDFNTTYVKMVWINADILQGPKGKKVEVKADDFFKSVKKLENATLSLGWTTGSELGKDGNYTEAQINEMIKTVNDSGVAKNSPITFAVRAILAINSEKWIKKLVDEVSKQYPTTTLTIWSADEDTKDVDAGKLQNFIKSFGVGKVYFDVPMELHSKVNVSSATSLVQFGLLNMVALSIAFFFRNALH